MKSPSQRLYLFAIALFALNVAATGLAIAVNWPAQFGGVGTDAGDEFLTRGTAISAPLFPMVLLMAVIVFARRAGRLGWIAIVGAYLTVVVVFIGGMGELVAEPTEDTPKAVLVAAGIGWAIVAVELAYLATKVVLDRRRPSVDA